jgi:hypothetical protein
VIESVWARAAVDEELGDEAQAGAVKAVTATASAAQRTLLNAVVITLSVKLAP